MPRNFWRILFLVFQAFWLNVVLPGHVRGMVTVAGSEGSCTTRSCCEPGGHTGGDPAGHESGDRASRCALCVYSVRMTPATYVNVDLGLLERTDERPVVWPESLVSLDRPVPYDGRGPPVL